MTNAEPKLFTALDRPRESAFALSSLALPPRPGLRRPAPDPIHLTLHFIGDADASRVASALARAQGRRFPLALEGVGAFRSPSGAVTVWVGAAATPALLDLHREVAATLGPEGFRPESRPYAPHVTVGRVEEGAEDAWIEDLRLRHASFRTGPEDVESFSLFSSERDAEGVPFYRRLRSFSLA
jgi:2'-5' RNA ligase